MGHSYLRSFFLLQLFNCQYKHDRGPLALKIFSCVLSRFLLAGILCSIGSFFECFQDFDLLLVDFVNFSG